VLAIEHPVERKGERRVQCASLLRCAMLVRCRYRERVIAACVTRRVAA
jgi:hypothetical protein